MKGPLSCSCTVFPRSSMTFFFFFCQTRLDNLTKQHTYLRPVVYSDFVCGVGSDTRLSQLPRARSSLLLAEYASDSTGDWAQGGFTSPA